MALHHHAPHPRHPAGDAIHPTTHDHPMTYHHTPATTPTILRRAACALALIIAAIPTAGAADDAPPRLNLSIIVCAPEAQAVALGVVQRVIGTDAEAGGLAAGSTLRVYWSTPGGITEAAGAIRILDTAVDTVEADGNGPDIGRLLNRLGGNESPATAPLRVPAAVDYLTRYAPPAGPDDVGAVVVLGPWSFGDLNPDPTLVPTEALLAQVEPRESPYGCARTTALPASWFAFGAGPAANWSPVALASYLRHRGGTLRDAIPAAPAADTLLAALRRAMQIPPLPAVLPDRPDGRAGFVRVVPPSVGDTPAAAPVSAPVAEAIRAAQPPADAANRVGETVVVTPLPATAPADGPLVASLVWYADDARGPKPIAADLDLWLAEGRDHLNFTNLRCTSGRLTTDLTCQGTDMQSEVIEYAHATADTVLGANVYRNATGKPALAALRVTWHGGVARLTMVLNGPGESAVGGDHPVSPQNGFRIRLGDLFGRPKPEGTP